jgi:hypothetical protein
MIVAFWLTRRHERSHQAITRAAGATVRGPHT